MNILVTGGAGYVGSHLIDYLLKQKKLKIFCIDNFSNSSKSTIKILKKKFKSSIYFEKIDIRNKKKINTFFSKNNIKCVIHLAAKIDAKKVLLKKKIIN